MIRKSTIIATGLLLGLSVLPAHADPTYPVTSLAQLLSGQIADFSNPQIDTYNFNAGVVGAIQRSIANATALLDPTQFAGPNAMAHLLANVQTIVDDTTKARPTLFGSSYGGVGDPYFMPDWSHHAGVLGTPADYDVDNSDRNAAGTFPYPCIAQTGVVTYRTTGGTCAGPATKGAAFQLGTARRLRVINSRGLRLAATLWVPAGLTTKTPGVVFADGFGSRQADYYMYPMILAENGFIALTYDEAGQGQSEGGAMELFSGGPLTDCPGVAGACRDLQDVVRWFVGDTITPVADSAPRLSKRASPAGNAPNPAAALLDTTRVGLMGQSMGSLSTTNYLHYLAGGKGADGRPLPHVAAAVGLSGFVPLTDVPVPFQAQTADYDLPGQSVSNGPIGATDGPVGTAAWYDQIKTSAKQLIINESGSHFDTTNAVGSPRPVWGASMSTHYAADWFNCYLHGDSAACADTLLPQPHLSKSFASEYDVAGVNRCMVVPTEMSLEQIESGGLRYDCKP